MKNLDYKYIFVHIFKCAGTFFLGGIRYSFKENEIWNYGTIAKNKKNITYVELAKDAKVIHGHCYYGVHKELKCKAVYFTVLRDPIDRILSCYYYLKESRCSGHPLHDVVKNFSLVECLNPLNLDIPNHKKTYLYEEFRNRQTRMLGKFILPTNLFDDNCDLETELSKIELDNSHLKTAIKALQNDFSFLGLAEEIESYWEFLNKKFGFDFPDKQWNGNNPHFTNKTIIRPNKNDVSDILKEEIISKNELDMELYSWALSNKDSINQQDIKIIS